RTQLQRYVRPRSPFVLDVGRDLFLAEVVAVAAGRSEHHVANCDLTHGPGGQEALRIPGGVAEDDRRIIEEEGRALRDAACAAQQHAELRVHAEVTADLQVMAPDLPREVVDELDLVLE